MNRCDPQSMYELLEKLNIPYRKVEHAEAGSMEDVISEYQTSGIVPDKLLTNDKGLCQTIWRRLFGIFELYSVIASIAQQTFESGKVMRSGNNQYLAYAGQHQHRYGVIYHRFIKDGEHLFAHPLCYGIEACSTASCQYNTFHCFRFWLFVVY